MVRMPLCMMRVLVIIMLVATVESDETPVDRYISTSEDDLEYNTDAGCTSTDNPLTIPFENNGLPQTVLLRFKDIPEPGPGFTFTEAVAEFVARGDNVGEVTAALHYNTMCMNTTPTCSAPTSDQISNKSIPWNLQASADGDVVTTPDIKELLQDNLESQCWKNTKRFELIITPFSESAPNPVVSHNFFSFDANFENAAMLLAQIGADVLYGSVLPTPAMTSIHPASTNENSVSISTPSPFQISAASSPTDQFVTSNSSLIPSSDPPSSSVAVLQEITSVLDTQGTQSTASRASPRTVQSTSRSTSIHPESAAANPIPNPTYTSSRAPDQSSTQVPTQNPVPSISPIVSCSTNIYLKGYRIVDHTSAVETVTSAMKCCKKCSEMRQSCKSFSIGKLTTPSGSTPAFICQINDITKEESDRSHCYTKDDTFTHYNVFP